MNKINNILYIKTPNKRISLPLTTLDWNDDLNEISLGNLSKIGLYFFHPFDLVIVDNILPFDLKKALTFIGRSYLIPGKTIVILDKVVNCQVIKTSLHHYYDVEKEDIIQDNYYIKAVQIMEPLRFKASPKR